MWAVLCAILVLRRAFSNSHTLRTARDSQGTNFCYLAHKIIPMEGQNHLCEMQRCVANVAITPSTFRKLGAGFVEAAQEFLASLNLKQLANLEPSEYPKWLEDQTQALMARFPLAERWGPARKSINIFMVMASLNQFLCDEYKLHRFEYVLEVPLDSTVTKKLRAWGKARNRVRRGQFPTFSIKQLKKVDSDQYQELARAWAEERGIPRGRIDIELWEPQRRREREQLAS